MKQTKFAGYEKSGVIMESVNAVIFLFIGIGVAIMVAVMVGTLSGKMYGQNEAEINAIANTQVKNAVGGAIVKSFQGLETLGSNVSIVVGAIVLALVVGVILTVAFVAQRAGNGGGAAL